MGRACRRCRSRTTTERSIEMNDGVSSSVVVGLLHCPNHTSMLAFGTPVLDESMEMRMLGTYLPYLGGKVMMMLRLSCQAKS